MKKDNVILNWNQNQQKKPKPTMHKSWASLVISPTCMARIGRCKVQCPLYSLPPLYTRKPCPPSACWWWSWCWGYAPGGSRAPTCSHLPAWTEWGSGRWGCRRRHQGLPSPGAPCYQSHYYRQGALREKNKLNNHHFIYCISSHTFQLHHLHKCD